MIKFNTNTKELTLKWDDFKSKYEKEEYLFNFLMDEGDVNCDTIDATYNSWGYYTGYCFFYPHTDCGYYLTNNEVDMLANGKSVTLKPDEILTRNLQEIYENKCVTAQGGL